jgi:hypothetical protein
MSRSAPSHTQRKIIGWEFRVYTYQTGMGKVLDYRIEYGASPVRDRKARLNKITELMRAGREYDMTPIFNRELTEDEEAKASKAPRSRRTLEVAGGA